MVDINKLNICCNSTVCSVSTNCKLNFDSGIERPLENRIFTLDKTTKTGHEKRGVILDVTHGPDCQLYTPVNYEQAWIQERRRSKTLELLLEGLKERIKSIGLALTDFHHENKTKEDLKYSFYEDEYAYQKRKKS